LHRAGVRFGVGTDNEDYHEELSRMVDAGMSPFAVLLAATRNGAQALRMGSRLGTIEKNKIADLILVAGRPWDDINDLKHIDVVIQSGRVVVDRRTTTTQALASVPCYIAAEERPCSDPRLRKVWQGNRGGRT
jgi:imidazolonepropionase-like amidohydrolase